MFCIHYLPGTRIKKILEPLAIAANVIQASHTRLDHVLLTLANLYRIYSSTDGGFDSELSEGVVRSIEKRWAKVNQDIYITAVFLNPFIRARIFHPSALTNSALLSIVERVYEKLLRTSSNTDFMAAFLDYKDEKGEFTRDAMHLQNMADRSEAEVCSAVYHF